nr:serine-threonine/tyrosine-protein kinase catalytic domain-containing protein [Tanacetum cinerariifolium]
MTSDDNPDGDKPETSITTPLVLPLTQQIPHTSSSIKLPILKKGEYDIWAMKMEHYLSHTDYPIWQVPTFFLSKVALMMRTKLGLDTLCFDDLYNNLRVIKRDVKGTTASSSSNIKNVAFVSADNTNNTNDVSTVYSVSSPSVSKSQKEGYASYTDEVIQSFFAILRIHLVLIRPKGNALIAIKLGILLETTELKGIKIAIEEMVGTMETKIEIMTEDLHIRMI